MVCNKKGLWPLAAIEKEAKGLFCFLFSAMDH